MFTHLQEISVTCPGFLRCCVQLQRLSSGLQQFSEFTEYAVTLALLPPLKDDHNALLDCKC